MRSKFAISRQQIESLNSQSFVQSVMKVRLFNLPSFFLD